MASTSGSGSWRATSALSAEATPHLGAAPRRETASVAPEGDALHCLLMGKRTSKEVPCPTTLSTEIVPPCARTMRSTMASPRPVLFSPAVARVLGALERLEEPSKLGGLDALPLIANRDDDSLLVPPHGDQDAAVGVGVLDGVGEEIVQHLLEPVGVDGDRRERLRRRDKVDADTLDAGEVAVERDVGRHELDEVDDLEVEHQAARLEGRQVEHVVDDGAMKSQMARMRLSDRRLLARRAARPGGRRRTDARS